MFRFSSRPVMGLARGVRFQSTSATKATSFVQNLSKKTSSTVNCIVYWSKVSAELAKQVYVKEGFAPPALGEFQTVYKDLFAKGRSLFKRWSEHPQEFVDFSKSFTKKDAYVYGAIGVQFAGLFALGEIIGRRHIVDYPHH